MAVETFQKYLSEHNLDIKILETSDTTRSAAEAAAFHGVPVGSIVKSLVLKTDDEFVVYLTPGDIRLNLDEVKKELGSKEIRLANADEVKKITGYSIGGVPPFGHKNKLKIYIHKDFSAEYPLYAAAGSHLANFETTLARLKELIKQ